jgi:plasmid stabilization system protein ParE
MRLRVARGAAADLDEIRMHVARARSPEAAERDVRALVAGSYRIYYHRPRKGIVRTLHIRHAARDETKLFRLK